MDNLDSGVYPEDTSVRRHTHQYATNIFMTIWAVRPSFFPPPPNPFLRILFFLQLIVRNLFGSWRMAKAVRMNMFVFFGLGLVLGFTFYQQSYNQEGTYARASLLYYALIVTNLITVRKFTPPPTQSFPFLFLCCVENELIQIT